MGTFRFLLAIAVAVTHYHGVWGYDPMITAEMAVQCFYMVSGFLIALILSGKYDTTTAAGLSLFYSNRALRIFVPYWTFLLLTAVSLWLAGVQIYMFAYWHEMNFTTRLYVTFTNIFILGQEWTNWLYYDDGALVPTLDSAGTSPHLSYFHIISQAWTISLELMFYALAPFLVRRHWLILAGYIVATIVARRLLGTFEVPRSGFVYRFFPLELGLFLAGVLSHRAFALLDARRTFRLPVSITVTAVMLIMLFAIRQLPFLDDHRYRFYVIVALALPFMFDVSRHIAADRWLGELSYPIYLCHIVVASIGFVIVGQDGGWFSLAGIAATVAVAVCYVRWIDEPFERWRQRRAERKSPMIFAAKPAERS